MSLFFWAAFSELANQDQEGTQAFFVKRGFQKLLHFLEWGALKFLGLLSEDGDSDAEELIAFTVFAFASFEESLGLGCDRRICQAF